MKKAQNDTHMFELYGFMQKHNISQQEFAEMIGVTPSAIVHWIKGRRDIPETVLRVVRFFDKHGLDLKDLEAVRSSS